ncbi:MULTISPECIES: helix-turn-helix domain-containing protein [unclassified Streptomyces]|uniref:winged helix-turn-helix transcriptional regulator n=1 Tax=unclassified Streptomyces TaxID=2593676 RepID=UPI00093F8D8A|nr:helix-turn-helix domain-containing protein [Streptomyces sp. CB02488]OKK18803.1 transcriptional regulator [Streptomyces sp. CB02488]WRZ11286.1 helix-turn-helix transcriptional regulator [Streptomyces sp. NBC_00341]
MPQPVETGRLPVPPGKSGCPINLTVELLGDRWSLVVLRDVMFGGHRHFRELLAHSVEGIASNILSARLSKLVGAGLLTRHDDPSHRQKIEYRLTEASIQLVPLMTQLGDWGSRWLPTVPELSIRAQLLARGGPDMGERFMDELRATHLEGRPQRTDGVLAELTLAYERAVAERAVSDGAVPAAPDSPVSEG